jgi:hypothetical protein
MGFFFGWGGLCFFKIGLYASITSVIELNDLCISVDKKNGAIHVRHCSSSHDFKLKSH